MSIDSVDEKFIDKQMQIAAQIDNYLKKSSWTQKKLADRAGIGQSQLSKILAGEANPTLRTIANLEEALGKDIIIGPDFYHGETEPEMEQQGGKEFSVSPESFETLNTSEETIRIYFDSQEVNVKRDRFEAASNFDFKPTG